MQSSISTLATVLCCLIFLGHTPVFASESAVDASYNALKDRVEGLKRDQIAPSKVNGLDAATIGLDIYYRSSNGEYLISGGQWQ